MYLGLFKNIKDAVSKYENARDEQAEYAKEYLRELKYLPENIIALIKWYSKRVETVRKGL